MKKKRILVVDDEVGFQDVFRYLLEPLGFAVHTTQNGMKGLEHLKKDDYDLIFSDIHMPKMSGLKLLQKIKKIRPHQLVVMMSSGSDSRDALEESVLELGAVCCLHKPFSIEQLLKIIEQTLAIKLTR